MAGMVCRRFTSSQERCQKLIGTKPPWLWSWRRRATRSSEIKRFTCGTVQR